MCVTFLFIQIVRFSRFPQPQREILPAFEPGLTLSASTAEQASIASECRSRRTRTSASDSVEGKRVGQLTVDMKPVARNEEMDGFC